jgi:hypothetical protein
MKIEYALALVLSLMLTHAVQAEPSDEAAGFIADVDECIRLAGKPTEAHRRSCLQDYAWLYVMRTYRRAARDHIWNDFRIDYPDFGDPPVDFATIASAMYWHDLPAPGPEGREYLLMIMSDRDSGPLVAHLKRAHGTSIDHQIATFLTGKFDRKRDLADLYALKTPDFFEGLKKKLPSVKAFMAAFKVDDLITNAAMCPAVTAARDDLFKIDWPRPKPPEATTEKVIERIVIHPHIVVLRVPEFALSITVEDHSMATGVYRWVTNTATSLEPCWRDHAKEHRD